MGPPPKMSARSPTVGRTLVIGVDDAAQGLVEHGPLQGHVLAHDAELLARRQVVLGQAAVQEDAQGGEVATEVGPAAAAEGADAALDVGVHDHPVALADVGDGAADLHHPAHVLVAQHYRRRRGMAALQDVEVAAADAGRLDFEQHLLFRRQRQRSPRGTSWGRVGRAALVWERPPERASRFRKRALPSSPTSHCAGLALDSTRWTARRQSRDLRPRGMNPAAPVLDGSSARFARDQGPGT